MQCADLRWRRGCDARPVRWRGCLGVEYGLQGSKIATQEQLQTSKAVTLRGKRHQRPCRQSTLEEIPRLSSLQASLSWRGEYNVGEATSGHRHGTCSATLSTEESAWPVASERMMPWSPSSSSTNAGSFVSWSTGVPCSVRAPLEHQQRVLY